MNKISRWVGARRLLSAINGLDTPAAVESIKAYMDSLGVEAPSEEATDPQEELAGFTAALVEAQSVELNFGDAATVRLSIKRRINPCPCDEFDARRNQCAICHKPTTKEACDGNRSTPEHSAIAQPADAGIARNKRKSGTV